MKFTVNSSFLEPIISAAAKVAKTAILGAHHDIKLIVKNGLFTVRAIGNKIIYERDFQYDLESGADGERLIEPSGVAKLLKVVKDQPVTLNMLKTKTKVTSEFGEYAFECSTLKDWPENTFSEETNEVLLTRDQITDIRAKSLPAIVQKQELITWTWYVHIIDGFVWASDTNVISCHRLENDPKPLNYSIPIALFEDLPNVADVRFNIGETWIMGTTKPDDAPSDSFSSLRIRYAYHEIKLPDFKRFAERERTPLYAVDREAFRNSIERQMAICEGAELRITSNPDEGTITLRSKNDEIGREFVESISIDPTIQDIAIDEFFISSNLLFTCLSSMFSDQVLLSKAGEGKALYLTDIDDDENFFSIALRAQLDE